MVVQLGDPQPEGALVAEAVLPLLGQIFELAADHLIGLGGGVGVLVVQVADDSGTALLPVEALADLPTAVLALVEVHLRDVVITDTAVEHIGHPLMIVDHASLVRWVEIDKAGFNLGFEVAEADGLVCPCECGLHVGCLGSNRLRAAPWLSIFG